MAKKIGVSASEMLRMREQGLSNKDIANLLEISYQTVLRYIGPQVGHMDNLRAFSKPNEKPVEIPTEEKKASPRAVDRLEMVYEIVKSADGTFRAELDYETKSISILDSTFTFDQLAELSTFIIGLTGRVENRQKN